MGLEIRLHVNEGVSLGDLRSFLNAADEWGVDDNTQLAEMVEDAEADRYGIDVPPEWYLTLRRTDDRVVDRQPSVETSSFA